MPSPSHAVILSAVLRENLYRGTIYASTNYVCEARRKLTLITINLGR